MQKRGSKVYYYIVEPENCFLSNELCVLVTEHYFLILHSICSEELIYLFFANILLTFG